MQYSKHSLIKRKQPQHQKRTYNQNYHLKRVYYEDKNVRILVSRCDICNEQLPETPDNHNLNLEARMNVVDEIDDSFESEHDKSTYEYGPKLLLCNYCAKEYLLPSYK
ncbi:MAG: hypothetical protein M3530_00885 [Thermoproteota archaeon]|nr:hypothetical protein [Thermoproteota archaeon]